MTLFLFACGGLVLLSSLFLLFPSRRSDGAAEELAQANLAWFRIRQAEIAASPDTDLEEDAQLRLLEEEQGGESATAAVTHDFPRWLLLPLVALLSSGIYYSIGGVPDVLITRDLQRMGADTTAADAADLIRRVEARAADRPDNLHYAAMLGRYYMGEQNYERAFAIYDDLVQAVPEDAQALAFAAQAEYLAAGRTLGAGARLRAEQALAADPHQPTALGLLGMASYEQQQYRAAIEYWERLLALETPGSEGATMIAGVIASARMQLGETGAAAAPAEVVAEAASVTSATATSKAGVTVQVSLPAEGRIDPAQVVFVLARNADSGSRMPIAVQRLAAGDLPVTLRLDDSNSMAGQKISSTAAVVVAVQVSRDGRPGESSASFLGEAGPLAPSEDTTPVVIQLAPAAAPSGP